MNSDVNVPINVVLLIAIGAIIAFAIGVWNHPRELRRLAARYLARAEALDLSRSSFDRSLRRWNKRLKVPEPQTHRFRLPGRREEQVKS